MFWLLVFFFFKQKTAYEMRISDWSSDVCSSDLFAVDRRGKSDAALDQRLQRLRPHRRAFEQPEVHAEATGIPEPRAAAHQWRVLGLDQDMEIGRASCLERVCQYV